MSVIVTYGDAKPDLLDPEALEHYGVKGMKWGVRRSDEELARARGERIKKSAKKQVDFYKKSASDVKKAVEKSNAKGRDINRARRELGEAKMDLLVENIKSVRPNKAKRKQAQRKARKIQNDILTNPDRAKAAQMTDGEKIVSLMFALPGGLPAVSSAAMGIGISELVAFGVRADVEYQRQKQRKKKK